MGDGELTDDHRFFVRDRTEPLWRTNAGEVAVAQRLAVDSDGTTGVGSMAQEPRSQLAGQIRPEQTGLILDTRQACGHDAVSTRRRSWRIVWILASLRNALPHCIVGAAP